MAFVYFAVGQAAGLRNGAQTAADAAALGAAQDARDQLREGWLEVLGDPGQWDPFVRGDRYTAGRACERAAELAALNEAVVDDCLSTSFGFRVTVHTEDTVGESLVPDTENVQATATATAVVEPRCSFDPPKPTVDPEPPVDPDPTEDPESTEAPSPTSSPEPEESEPILGLVCDDETLSIDPEDPVLPEAEDLFHVRLTGDDE
ncbi:hypothetical protein [Streptomyces filamentosus]|uniref:hypothetical protein n=1 Tax=Streptomyces filamentosus TaxID=67294 RepID=UPI003325579C